MKTQPNFSVRMGEKNMAYKLVVSTTETTITTTTKQQQKQQSWIATYVSVDTKAKPMSMARQTAHS
jgi:hypothetical protein